MISDITSREFQGAADLAAMQAALAGWIMGAGNCGYCHIGDLPHRIYNGLRGRYPTEALVRLWRAGGTVLAFSLSSPRMSGFDAFVSPDHRGGALEREVLTWGYETTRRWMDREGKNDSAVITDVDDGDETRSALLLELGFQPDNAPWLVVNERSLDGDLPEIVLPEGYHIRGAVGDEDAEQLAAVHSGAFGSSWTAEIYREEVMHKPGYTPELERVVVAPDGRFAAFCLIWLDERNRLGLFEPVGTHEAFQRMGLGRALLASGLHLMRERGMERAQVCSETDNAASSGLYGAMGFEPLYRVASYLRPAVM
jgi:mycothiol synthase